jgi:DNA-binding response OmpR family regulator
MDKASAQMRNRILLIEDDLEVAKTIEYALKTIGYEVTYSTHGTDAIRLCELIDPDLVITDLIMPDADTFDTIEELRRFRPDVRILAISGNPHLLRLAAKHGANHVLPKPFDAGRLNMLVKVILA